MDLSNNLPERPTKVNPAENLLVKMRISSTPILRRRMGRNKSAVRGKR